LGTLKKFMRWFKKDNVDDLIYRLQSLANSLKFQVRMLEREERQTRMQAIKYKKQGKDEAARMYAAEMVKFRKSALMADRYRLHIVKLIAQIKRAQMTGRMNAVLAEVAGTLDGISAAIDAEEIAKNADMIARKIREFEIEGEISGSAIEASSPEVSPDELDAALKEITAAAKGEPVEISAEDSLEKEVKELEKKLGTG